MDVDTRHLRAFLAVVDEGTFTDAAAVLRTSQASVSRSVQRLEAAVGRRLLTRTTRHVETTTAGDRVAPYARRMLATLDRLAEAVPAVAGDLRLGYAWSALGGHTVAVQRRWAAEQGGDLVLVHARTPTGGLLEGQCDVAVVRRPVDDRRLDGVEVATEPRWAALAADHPLAGRTDVTLADLAGLTVAVDTETGTTTEELWASPGPAAFRPTRGVEEWLVLIASGRAVGVTSEATVAQHPRPGVVYRPVRDAPPVSVRLVWWRDDPPAGLAALREVLSDVTGGAAAP